MDDEPWPKNFARLIGAQRRDPEVRLVARVDSDAMDAVTAAGLTVSDGGYVQLPEDVEDPDAWGASTDGLFLRPDGVLALDG